MLDTKALAATLLQSVREWVEPAMKAFDKRMVAIEQRAAIVPEKGEPGKDADPQEIQRAVQEAVDALPKPKDGESVTVEDLAPLIAEQVRAAVEAIPKPADGKSVTAEEVQALVEAAVAALPPAKPGENGKSITMDDVRPALDEMFAKALPDLLARVETAIKELPVPKNGEPGKSVTLDDVRPLVEAARDAWALEFERHAQGVLMRAVENMPKPKDGADALPLDGFEAELADDGRTVVLRLMAGELKKEARLTLPVIIDRGVFKDGDYDRGDVVTFGGTAWIATKDAPQGKPGDGESTDWRVFARRGRDGKDLRPEEPRDPVVVRVA